MRVVEADEEGGALERMLLPRDVVAEGAAGGGPAARVELVDVFATVASFTLGGEGGNPLSMEVGEANIFCCGAFAEAVAVAVAAVASKVGGSDIVLVTRADLCGPGRHWYWPRRSSSGCSVVIARCLSGQQGDHEAASEAPQRLCVGD